MKLKEFLPFYFFLLAHLQMIISFLSEWEIVWITLAVTSVISGVICQIVNYARGDLKE